MAHNEANGAVLDREHVDHKFPLNLDPIVAKVDEGIAVLERVLPEFGVDPAKTAHLRHAIETLRDIRKTTRAICPSEEWGSA